MAAQHEIGKKGQRRGGGFSNEAATAAASTNIKRG
jgi:hypothetical protein